MTGINQSLLSSSMMPNVGVQSISTAVATPFASQAQLSVPTQANGMGRGGRGEMMEQMMGMMMTMMSSMMGMMNMMMGGMMGGQSSQFMDPSFFAGQGFGNQGFTLSDPTLTGLGNSASISDPTMTGMVGNTAISNPMSTSLGNAGITDPTLLALINGISVNPTPVTQTTTPTTTTPATTTTPVTPFVTGTGVNIQIPAGRQDLASIYLQSIDQNGNINHDLFDNFQNMGPAASEANIYLQYFKEFLIGGRNFDGAQQYAATSADLNKPGDLFAAIASTYRVEQGPDAYNKQALKELLASGGSEGQALAAQSGVGDFDVETLSAVTKGLNDGVITLNQIIDGGSNKYITNPTFYTKVIDYVKSGTFAQDAANLEAGNYAQIPFRFQQA